MTKTAVRCGWYAFTHLEFHSNIMGKHSYARVRLCPDPIHSIKEGVDILVAYDAETEQGDADLREYATHNGHLDEVVPGGLLVVDSGRRPPEARSKRPDIDVWSVPASDIVNEAMADLDPEAAAGSPANRGRADDRLRNMALWAVGAFRMGLPLELVSETVADHFKGKNPLVPAQNVATVRRAYGWAESQPALKPHPAATKVQLPQKRRYLVRGYQVVAVAKLRAGLGFQTYYPISPATDESVFLERYAHKQGLTIVQTEDEISAMVMAVGAAYAGMRSATSTAGPGFVLMTEGMGFAGMLETPGPVVYLYQRGGPSTGLPTRQEQSDLAIACHPGTGEFPHIVVAPGTPDQMSLDSAEALAWAERWQMPVIVLLDRYLAGAQWTYDKWELPPAFPDRGEVVEHPDRSYRRYALTESGVSPRVVPGTPGTSFTITSDEHDWAGHITEGPEIRQQMMDKRLRKLDAFLASVEPERTVHVDGPDDSDICVVCWGSPRGPLLDAAPRLAEEGVKVRVVQVRLVHPVPVKALHAALDGQRNVVVMENNATGQMADLLEGAMHRPFPRRLLLYNGRPFSETTVFQALRAIARGEMLDNVDQLVYRHPDGAEPIPKPARRRSKVGERVSA
jgi:2-oxoglutarate ferredoxin oxidoreductase subunit alpha